MLGATEVIGGGSGADVGLFDATCSAGILPGMLVFFTGVAGPEVALCDPTDRARMPCAGAVASKESLTTCKVRSLGPATLWATLSIGKTYWVGLDGYPSATPPTGLSNEFRVAQTIGKALSTTTLQLAIAEVVHGFRR